MTGTDFISMTDRERFSPKYQYDSDVWRKALEVDHKLNYVSFEYNENIWRLNMIAEHFYCTANNPENVSKHVVTPCGGEGDEYADRLNISSRLYMPYLLRENIEMTGKIKLAIHEMVQDGKNVKETGIIDSKYPDFWKNAGGDNVSYDDLCTQIIQILVAFGVCRIEVKPPLSIDGEVSGHPTIHVSPPLYTTRQNSPKFSVERYLMTAQSETIDDKPKRFVVWETTYPDRKEYAKYNADKDEVVDEAPYKGVDSTVYFFPNKHKFSDSNGDVTLPVFFVNLGSNKRYMSAMAGQNSHLYNIESGREYLRFLINSPLIAADIKNSNSQQVDMKILEELKKAIDEDYSVLPVLAKYIAPDAGAFSTLEESIKNKIEQYRMDMFLKHDERSVQMTNTQAKEESSIAESFIALVLDKLADAETQALVRVVECASPGNLQAKQAIKIHYPANYDKEEDRHEEIESPDEQKKPVKDKGDDKKEEPAEE